MGGLGCQGTHSRDGTNYPEGQACFSCGLKSVICLPSLKRTLQLNAYKTVLLCPDPKAAFRDHQFHEHQCDSLLTEQPPSSSSLHWNLVVTAGAILTLSRNRQADWPTPCPAQELGLAAMQPGAKGMDSPSHR